MHDFQSLNPKSKRIMFLLITNIIVRYAPNG